MQYYVSVDSVDSSGVNTETFRFKAFVVTPEDQKCKNCQYQEVFFNIFNQK